MTITDTIVATYQDVWAWREQSAAWFVIPDTSDALAFAVTEAGEAVDAYLREIGPDKGYKRNHVKDADLWAELGDCFFMCTTALGPSPTETIKRTELPDQCELWDIAVSVDKAWQTIKRWTFTGRKDNLTWFDWTVTAMYQIAMLFSTHGHDLRATVQARMHRLEAKHKETVTP
jgi:hypothetical protein